MTKNIKKDIQHDVYFIVPVYNIDVEENLVNKRIAGYKILKNTTVLDLYCPKLMYTEALHEDIKQPFAGMLSIRPLARYVFLKKIRLYTQYDKDNNTKNHDIIQQETSNFISLIIAMRLHKKGNIQVNRFYVMSSKDYRSFDSLITTPLSFISNPVILDKIVCTVENYNLTFKDIKKILSIRNRLCICDKSLYLPIQYFMDYYSFASLTDKIIKICTIWETTILNDCKTELQYRLKVRGSAFLNKNYSTIFETAYDIRSQLLHKGKADYKKLKKIISNQYTKNATFLLAFLNDYLEPITRDILNKFIKIQIKTTDNLSTIAKDIDTLVLKKISS